MATIGELPDYLNKLPKIPQHGMDWCIPASIENMLKYAGIHSLSQEVLVEMYCRKFSDDGLIKKVNGVYYAINIPAISDKVQLLEIASKTIFHRANFRVFKEIVESTSELQGTGWKLDFDDSLTDQDNYYNRIMETIDNGFPSLIAAKNLDGNTHIRVALAYSPGQIKVFDPDPTKLIVDEHIAQLKFNNDILVLMKC
jgi:hypothetical protein